jgi:hypothetical protein
MFPNSRLFFFHHSQTLVDDVMPLLRGHIRLGTHVLFGSLIFCVRPVRSSASPLYSFLLAAECLIEAWDRRLKGWVGCEAFGGVDGGWRRDATLPA